MIGTLQIAVALLAVVAAGAMLGKAFTYEVSRRVEEVFDWIECRAALRAEQAQRRGKRRAAVMPIGAWGASYSDAVVMRESSAT